MIKALIFDLGNVIVPVETERTIAELAALCWRDPAELRALIAASDELDRHQTGRMTTADLIAHLHQLLSFTCEAEVFNRAWNSMLVPTPLLPTELFRELSERYRLIVLSDTNEIHFEYIRENYEAMKYFDDFVLSYEVGDVKPSPVMFREAVRRAGCDPGECLFTDDKPINIEGAINCGLQAILFTTLEMFLPELKDWVVDFGS